MTRIRGQAWYIGILARPGVLEEINAFTEGFIVDGPPPVSPYGFGIPGYALRRGINKKEKRGQAWYIGI